MFTNDQLLDLTLQYNTQGYVHLKQLLPADLLARARAAFDACAAHHAPTTQARRNAGARFVDLPGILDEDAVFIDLVDLPQLLPLLRASVGEDLALQGTSARLFFPGPTFTSPYHSDIAQICGIDPARSPGFLAKVHFYLEDLASEQGCLSFIPGSQHLPALHVDPHRRTLATSGAALRVVPRAGDAILFNTHVLHMAEANGTDHTRKSLIYSYSHYWVKAFPSAAPRDLRQFDGNPQRQQLFGVDVPGISHFNRRLDTLHPPGVATRVQNLTERIARKLAPPKTLPPRA